MCTPNYLDWTVQHMPRKWSGCQFYSALWLDILLLHCERLSAWRDIWGFFAFSVNSCLCFSNSVAGSCFTRAIQVSELSDHMECCNFHCKKQQWIQVLFCWSIITLGSYLSYFVLISVLTSFSFSSFSSSSSSSRSLSTGCKSCKVLCHLWRHFLP